MMRLYITLSRNSEIIPFNYQHLLTGVIHKWIGENNLEHGKAGLWSFSWIQNASVHKNGLNLSNDSFFFFSAHHANLIKKVAKGILNDPNTFCGSRVLAIQIKETPVFSSKEHFEVSSPILIKKRDGEKIKHLIYSDIEFDRLLTENLMKKLESAGLPNENVRIELDKNYVNPKTKLVDYKGIKNRGTIAPLIINGTPEQVSFAWNVGVGNSTGIGFGSLK